MPTDVFFISIQATYQSLGIALFKNNDCIASVLSEQARASSSLIAVLQDLLKAQGVSFEQLSFIVADAGPGAFTSLRVVIATVNGLAFAANIPLVSVSTFEGFVAQLNQPHVLMLLNAFNNDVYFAYANNGLLRASGCVKYTELPAILAAEKTPDLVHVVGNGLHVYTETMMLLQETFPHFEETAILVPSAENIGIVGYKKWQHGQTVKKLEPLYLKTLLYQEQGKPSK